MSHIALGVISIVGGLFLGTLLFVPFVALVYRREGRLAGRAVLIGVTFIVYFMAIWVYTLLPLPDPDAVQCVAAPQLDVLRFIGDLRGAVARGHPLTDRATLQLALNALLFLPLGVFVRIMLRRGILVATAIGLGISLLVEFTQLTGVWGLYPCAYRVFDVDDLLTNTLGAVIGSLLALFLPAKYRVPEHRLEDADLPRPVTRGRRLLSMLCDVLVVTVLQAGVQIAILVLLEVTEGRGNVDSDAAWIHWTGVLVPFAISAGMVLVTGQTIGQAAVQLRYTAPGRPAIVTRLLVFLGGIGGFQVLTELPSPWGGILTPLFVLTAFVLVFTTTSARGLPGILSGARLADARETEASRRYSPP